MKKLSIFQIDAFTDKAFGGNPAAVVYSHELSDEEMRHIAAEMNLSETAFLGSSVSADYKLRWMTPVTEVNLCGHATIASLHFLRETGRLNENSAVRFETRSGIIKCCTEKNMYYMQIPPFTIRKFELTPGIMDALGISAKQITGDPLILDNGYLYIRVNSLKILGKIRPDFRALSEMSSGSGAHAFVLYTTEIIDPESTAHLRFFDPLVGINEDPVTGSANGPLISILETAGLLRISGKTEVQFEQGDFMGRPGRVRVIDNSGRIFIGGKAVTVLRGEIQL